MNKEMQAMQVAHMPKKSSGALHNTSDLREALSTALKDEYPEKKSKLAGSDNIGGPYVRETLVRTSGGQVICEKGGKMYRHDFSVDADGDVTITGGGEEVQQKTEYEPVNEGDDDDGGAED